jgi:glycosyltransferase involved in cell wall biosynthesis
MSIPASFFTREPGIIINNNEVRIGIEGQRLWRSKKHGMDFVALELVRKLQSLDQHNEYFIFIKTDKDRCLKSSSNFTVVELPDVPYPYWEQVLLAREVKKYKIDLLHCTGNTAPLFTHVPLLVTLHDVIYLENNPVFNYGSTSYQRFGNLYRRWVVPRIMKTCQAITTVSDYEKKTILQFFPGYDNKVHVIHNGVAGHFKPITDFQELNRIKQTYRLPEKYIFYQGNTDPKKNTRNVLIAYAKYCQDNPEPVKLLIIDFERSRLLRMLREVGFPELIENIHCTGYIINPDLPAIYSMSELFLYPSLRESFGIPLLEAMRCGTPVITSDTSAMPEIAGKAARYCNPADPVQMADTMAKLMADPAGKNELIRLGFEKSALFSWDNAALEMMKLYNRMKI